MNGALRGLRNGGEGIWLEAFLHSIVYMGSIGDSEGQFRTSYVCLSYVPLLGCQVSFDSCQFQVPIPICWPLVNRAYGAQPCIPEPLYSISDQKFHLPRVP